MEFTANSLPALGALAATALLSACAGPPHLYSEVRDKQGIAAKEAWKAVDINDQITTERSNLNKLLAAQLEAQDRLTKLERDGAVRALVSGSSVDSALGEPVRKRLGDLAGTPDAFKPVTQATLQLKAFEATGTLFIAPAFSAAQLPVPDCASLKKRPVPDGVAKLVELAGPEPAPTAMASPEWVKIGSVKAALVQLKADCDALPDVGATVAALPAESPVRLAWKQYSDDKEALATATDGSSAKQLEYKAAKDAYQKAVGDEKAGKTAASQVATAKKRLQDAIKALDSAPESISTAFISKERLAELNSLLSALDAYSPDKPVTAGAGQVAALLVLVPNLVDSQRAAELEARKPVALPLLIARDNLELQLEAAQRNVKAHQEMVRLSKQMFDTSVEEAEAVISADAALKQAPELLKMRPTEAMTTGDANKRVFVYRAATRYIDSIYRLQGRRLKLQYTRLAVIDERALAYAEVNAKQWQSLIGTTVDQNAAYHAGGIKPESIMGLVNSLGIIWIGVGVN